MNAKNHEYHCPQNDTHMKQSTYRKLRAQEYDIGTDHTSILAFYLAEWRRRGSPTPVLEPMSGTGINLIPFLEAGIETDGLDSSPHMLEICRQKCQAKGLDCTLYEQFLEEMELPRHYGFMLIPGGSFGHIYDTDVAAESLHRMREHLLPGGWLVLDVRTPAFMQNFGADGEVDHDLSDFPNGSTVLTTGYWQHLDNGRVIRKWNKMERFVDDVLTETEIFDYRERMYDLDELATMISRAGFSPPHVTQAYVHDADPHTSDGLVFSCQNPAS